MNQMGSTTAIRTSVATIGGASDQELIQEMQHRLSARDEARRRAEAESFMARSRAKYTPLMSGGVLGAMVGLMIGAWK